MTQAALTKQKASEILRPTGWKVSQLKHNPNTGFVKIVFSRTPNPSTGTICRLTVLRPSWGSVCVDISYVEVRDGFCGQWLEDVGGLGWSKFSNPREALRFCGHFINDNPGATAISGSNGYALMAEVYKKLQTA